MTSKSLISEYAAAANLAEANCLKDGLKWPNISTNTTTTSNDHKYNYIITTQKVQDSFELWTSPSSVRYIQKVAVFNISGLQRTE